MDIPGPSTANWLMRCANYLCGWKWSKSENSDFFDFTYPAYHRISKELPFWWWRHLEQPLQHEILLAFYKIDEEESVGRSARGNRLNGHDFHSPITSIIIKPIATCLASRCIPWCRQPSVRLNETWLHKNQQWKCFWTCAASDKPNQLSWIASPVSSTDVQIISM